MSIKEIPWELNQVQKELLNQLASQTGVNGTTKIPPGIRHHLSLTSTRKVIRKGIIASNKASQRNANTVLRSGFVTPTSGVKC